MIKTLHYIVKLHEIKKDIKSALKKKGAEPTDDFCTYPDLITKIAGQEITTMQDIPERGVYGKPFKGTIVTDAAEPYTVELVGGQLPKGLRLEDRYIVGTPEDVGAFYRRFKITDPAGNTWEGPIRINIQGQPVRFTCQYAHEYTGSPVMPKIKCVEYPEFTYGTHYAFKKNGKLITELPTERGHYRYLIEFIGEYQWKYEAVGHYVSFAIK